MWNASIKQAHKRKMKLLKPLKSIVSIFCFNIFVFCVQGMPVFPDLSVSGEMNSFLKQMLNVKSGDQVPEYEIVQVRILSKRSVEDQNNIRIHLTAFGKDIHLHLQKNGDFNNGLKHLKVYEGKPTNAGLHVKEIKFQDDDPGTPYIDPVQMAAVTIHYGPDGKLQMDGEIGDDLLIKFAPTDITFCHDNDSTNDTEKSINSSRKNIKKSFGYSSTTPTTGVHVVYRSLAKSKISSKVALDNLLNSIYSDEDRRHHKQPLQAWPEVLLMVDYDTYAMHVSHGFNDTQIRRYCVTFLNGVDLRFKILSDPKISLILSQIIIFKSADSFPCLRNNLFPNASVFDGDAAIREMAYNLYRVKTQQRYAGQDFDVALLLTNLDMCSVTFNRQCSTKTVGLAYFKGACNTFLNERWMGVAIVEDNGGFDGILTAAHEIGHLLGADHDGSLLNPKDSICHQEDGYIMSDKLTSDKIFQWSDCSIKQFRNFLSSERALCLFNEPSYHNELEEGELPGNVLSLDEQCKRLVGTEACVRDGRVCMSLHCYQPKEVGVKNCLKGLVPAAEGSSCGEDNHCRHGKCVPKSLVYSQAWNMAPNRYNLDYDDSFEVDTNQKSPFSKACTEDEDEFFCDSYFWIIPRTEACKNSRILQECCYSFKTFCKVGSL